MPSEKKLVGYIDAEPTWESLLPILVPSASGLAQVARWRAEFAWSELEKMARAADAYRALQKAGKVP